MLGYILPEIIEDEAPWTYTAAYHQGANEYSHVVHLYIQSTFYTKITRA